MLCAIVMLFLLSSCGKMTVNPPEWALNGEPEYVTEWPENRFTADIPKPEAGEVDYVVDYSAGGRYEIVMKNIPRAASNAYLRQLCEAGFTDEAAGSGNVSMGTLLRRGNVVLSVAASGEGMVMLITIE